MEESVRRGNWTVGVVWLWAVIGILGGCIGADGEEIRSGAANDECGDDPPPAPDPTPVPPPWDESVSREGSFDAVDSPYEVSVTTLASRCDALTGNVGPAAEDPGDCYWIDLVAGQRARFSLGEPERAAAEIVVYGPGPTFLQPGPIIAMQVDETEFTADQTREYRVCVLPDVPIKFGYTLLVEMDVAIHGQQDLGGACDAEGSVSAPRLWSLNWARLAQDTGSKCTYELSLQGTLAAGDLDVVGHILNKADVLHYEVAPPSLRVKLYDRNAAYRFLIQSNSNGILDATVSSTGPSQRTFAVEVSGPTAGSYSLLTRVTTAKPYDGCRSTY